MGKVVTSSKFGDLLVTSKGALEPAAKSGRAPVTPGSHPVNVTKDRIRKFQYQGNGKSRCVYWDTVLTGFGVRVYPSGKKSYVISYRFEGRKRLHTLGKVEAYRQVDDARDSARGVLADVSKGSDPQAERKRAQNSPLMRDLYDRYMHEHARPHKKPGSIRDVERMWKKVILPKLGHRRVDEVKRQDVIRIHNSLRKTPYQANRVLALLSKAFNLAELWELRDQNTNPTDHIRRYKETKRERLISEDEMARLAKILDEVEETGHVTMSPDGGGWRSCRVCRPRSVFSSSLACGWGRC